LVLPAAVVVGRRKTEATRGAGFPPGVPRRRRPAWEVRSIRMNSKKAVAMRLFGARGP
jgi:hypothetical protein